MFVQAKHELGQRACEVEQLYGLPNFAEQGAAVLVEECRANPLDAEPLEGEQVGAAHHALKVLVVQCRRVCSFVI